MIGKMSKVEKTEQNGHKNSGKLKWAIRIIALIIIILLLFLCLYKCGGQVEDDAGYIIGAGVREGEIDTDGGDESGAGSNGKSDMRIKMNGKPTFADGESNGNLNIENPAENALFMNVDIMLNDTGEVIYESGAIPPNHHVANGKLAKILKKGEYEATAHVTLFDPDNPDSNYNSANFKLIITIEN